MTDMPDDTTETAEERATFTLMVLGSDGDTVEIPGVLGFEALDHGYFISTESYGTFMPWHAFKAITFIKDGD